MFSRSWNNNAGAVANDFNMPGLGLTHKDSNRTIFTGYFRAKVAGEYEFESPGRMTVPLSSSTSTKTACSKPPETRAMSGSMKDTVPNTTVSHLQPGLYRYAAGHYQGGSGQTIEIRFSTPTGAGRIRSQPSILPASPRKAFG